MASQVISGRARDFVPGSAFSETIRFPQNFVTPSASALFAGLSQHELSQILSCARVRSFACDELLYSQGETARSLLVLQSGSVKHTQLSPNGDEVLLRMSGPGEAVNLQTPPNSSTHTCSARAMEESRAWVWEHNRLQELLDRYSRLHVNISLLLTSRLQELEERFREISTEKVARRLALVLLRLVKQVGKRSGGGAQVSLSREELAQMTGTTLFTISRVLSSWAELGLVIPKREAVVILDAIRLETVSEEMA
jgi:CRP-like cAMP-binding protein